MIQHESLIRLAAFVAVLATIALAETLAPRRARVANRRHRSLNNLLLVAIDSLLVRALPALSAVAAAAWASIHGVGLLNWVAAPWWCNVIVTLVVFDLIIYGQHVATHRIPTLWRFHRVHHADLDLDATSGLRFHPVEIGLSMVVKVIAAVLLGAAPVAVMLFEVGLNASSMFNHGNLGLRAGCDRILRWFVVTPDMHRVHHSVRPDEMHRNFGFNLPWWDWLFGTYRAQPTEPHEHLELGLPDLRDEAQTVPVVAMLLLPFRRGDTISRSLPTDAVPTPHE